jgi:hypothetical protein
VLDALNPSGSAPAERAKYRCTTCPPGEPLAFVVFPKPARFASYGGSGGIYTIDVGAGGGVPFLSAITLHAAWGHDRAVGVYKLDSTLRPVHVDTADSYQSTYDALVREASIPAFQPARVDPDAEFLPILHWVAGTFVPIGLKAD